MDKDNKSNSIFSRLFKSSKSNADVVNSINESANKTMKTLFTALSNLTPEDISNLENLANGKVTRDAIESPTVSKYLGLVNSVFNRNSMFLEENRLQTRQQLYEIYDEMDDTIAYVSSALDILSDDATQPDDKGNVITFVAGNDKVQSILDDMKQDLELEQLVAKWARVIAKYGDFFVQVFGEKGKGVVRVSDTTYPGYIERKEVDGRLVAFKDSRFLGTTSDNLYAPWEYVHFKHKGDIYRDEDTANLIDGKNTYNLTSSYGQSVLKSSIKVYAQLRFVENMVLLSRLTNSIRRNIFLINVGEVAPDKAMEAITNYANLLKKDISLDLESSMYNSSKRTITYDEDIFLPIGDPKNDVRIEQVGGDVNITEQYDLEYLLNKLFASLKIPKAYLNYEQDLNARSTLVQLDIRYARSVSRLQQTIIGGLTRLAKIHLAYKGIDPDTVDLEVKLAPVSSIDEDAKREQNAKIAEEANTIWGTLVTMNKDLSSASGDDSGMLGEQPAPKGPQLDLVYGASYILKDVLKFDEDIVSELMKEFDEDKDKDKSKELLSNGKLDKVKKSRQRIRNSIACDALADYPYDVDGVDSAKRWQTLKESIVNKSNDELSKVDEESTTE